MTRSVRGGSERGGPGRGDTGHGRATCRASARVLAGLLATGLAVVGFGGAAVADPMNPTTPEDGLWYYYQLHLDEIHASGITGAGVTIAVFDSPLNLEVPTLQGASIQMKDAFCHDRSGTSMPGTSTDWDLASHGTQVVSLIVGSGAGYPGGVGVKGVAPGAKILYYPTFVDESVTCYDASGDTTNIDDLYALQIEDAIASGAQIISTSIGYLGPVVLEAAIADAMRHEVVVVSALANAFEVDGFPSSMNGVVSVLSGASDGTLETDRFTGEVNTSDFVDVVAPGVNILQQGGTTSKDWTRQSWSDGTSWAAPIVAGELALDMQKYPDATSNQILQSVIHNTGPTGVSHDPAWDASFGYGTVSARTLLPADPTQYEDVNPFIDPSITDSDPNGPSVAEIAGTATATPTPGVTPTDPGPTPTDSSSLVPLLIVGGIVLLLIIAVVVIIVIVAARKPRKGQTPS